MTERKKNPMSRQEICRLGGLATSRRHPGHMSRIGKISAEKNPRSSEFMARIGRAGGHCVSVAVLDEIIKQERLKK